MLEVDIDNFLKLRNIGMFNEISRNSPLIYECDKTGLFNIIKEPLSSHLFGVSEVGEYFLTFDEFKDLDKDRVRKYFLRHDHTELITKDVGISDTKGRVGKLEREIAAIPYVLDLYPDEMKESLERDLLNFYSLNDNEIRFVKAVDKMQALLNLSDVKYKYHWGPRGFDESGVDRMFLGSFEHSETFKSHYDVLQCYLREEGFFETKIPLKVKLQEKKEIMGILWYNTKRLFSAKYGN